MKTNQPTAGWMSEAMGLASAQPRIDSVEPNTTLSIIYPVTPYSEFPNQNSNITHNLRITIDANGNLISGFGKTFEYNNANQLARVKDGANTIAEYSYDFAGRRFKKTSGSETTYYIGKDFETKINSSGAYNTAYYYANGELLSRKDPDGKRYFYHNDHLTGTNVVTDSAGNLVERTRYKPFGSIIEGGASRNLFTGQEFDKDTGQYYYGARYYNPELMRFTQADPVIQNLYDPQQLNRYSYTLNNPVKYADPSGNVIQIPIGIAMYVSALVSSPDLSMDAAYITHSALAGDYESAGYGVVGLALPGVLAAEAGPAGKLLRKGIGEKIGLKLDDVFKGSSRLPQGFSSAKQFENAVSSFKAAAGDEKAILGVRGSSASGVSSKGGGFRFEATSNLPKSDIDFFIVSDKLYNQGIEVGAKTKDGGIVVWQTEEYFPELFKISEDLSKNLDRHVSIRVFSTGGYSAVKESTDIIR